jgi:hypothetical protein
VEDINGSWQKTLNLSDLNNPETLWADLGRDGGAWFAGGGRVDALQGVVVLMAGSVQWQAHEDWMMFGHTKARVYRLETVILGRHINVFTSRVGEILKVELPNKITLRNDAFEHFSRPGA